MPNYKGHLVGGTVVAGVLIYALQFVRPSGATMARWLACTLVGSLFPDIDTKSKGQLMSYRIMVVLLFLLIATQRIQLALMVSSVAFLPLVVHHRGLFHRAWFIIALCAGSIFATWVLLPTYVVAVSLSLFFFCAGALSHLYLDLGWKRMWR